TYISCKGSVDTPLTGVDTVFQTLRQNDEEKVKCVDTASSGVDTKPSSQRTQLTGLYSVSTQPQVVCVDTSDPSQRTNSASLGQCVDTLRGQVDTLRKLFHFKFHLDTWHSRVHMDRSWIMCLRTQGYFWTHWAINTLKLAIQPKRTFSEPSRNPFGGKKSSPPCSCSSCAVATKLSSLQALEVKIDP
ncbi:hypothetical protein Taro_038117, partial [Colocasia esculenta]|nr:hypothetical protein [Colocasia esculenta]